jgi:hypothetical protein
MRFFVGPPLTMRCTKMPGVWMCVGVEARRLGTRSSTSATVTLPAVAIIGLKLRAVLR